MDNNDDWKAGLTGALDTVAVEEVEASKNNPYYGIEEPSKFTVQAIVLITLPEYLHSKVEDLKDLSPAGIQKTAVMLTAMVQGLGDLTVAGRYVTASEVEGCIGARLEKLCKLNPILLPKKVRIEPARMVALSKELKWINEDFTYTDMFLDLLKGKDKSYPSIAAGLERLRPYVKNNTKGNAAIRLCSDNLEKVEYHVDVAQLRSVEAAIALIENPNSPFTYQEKVVTKEALATTEYVRKACSLLVEQSLYSQYDADNRGRMYHIACAGPNPQSGDEERSYYSLSYEQTGVKKGSPAFNMFIAELKDIGGGFTSAMKLAWVAQNSVEFLAKAYVAQANDYPEIEALGKMLKVPSKPNTLLRLARDYVEFLETGLLKSTVGFGLDAKCSGTQYFAICAGDKNMALATGLTTSSEKVADPYMQSVKLFKEMLKGTEFEEYIPVVSRDFIKTPYMAVQYGGTEGALMTSKEYVQALKKIGFNVDHKKKLGEFAALNVEAIQTALGSKIASFIKNTEDLVGNRLWELNGFKMETVVNMAGEEEEVKQLAPFLEYRHSDGFNVSHKSYSDLKLCPSFSINLGGTIKGAKVMDFGAKGGNYSVRDRVPSGEEFTRTFCVNYIQGLDALVARTVVNKATESGLVGVTSIHDCFRTCLEDAPKLKQIIADAYKEVFVDRDVVADLYKQLNPKAKLPMFRDEVVNEEVLNHENSYYFCQ